MPRPEARPPSVVAKSSKSHGPVGAPLLEAPPTTQGGGFDTLGCEEVQAKMHHHFTDHNNIVVCAYPAQIGLKALTAIAGCI